MAELEVICNLTTELLVEYIRVVIQTRAFNKRISITCNIGLIDENLRHIKTLCSGKVSELTDK